ncbi:MAG: preprotein translocase subunit SecE [Eubacteriales bacterium]
MGNANTVKRSWWKEFKGDFKKIVWPDKKSLVKSTSVVLFVSVFLGVIIFLLDTIFRYGINYLLELSS